MELALRMVNPSLLGQSICGTRNVTVCYGQFDQQIPPATVEIFIKGWSGVSAFTFKRGHRTMGTKLFTLRQKFAEWLDVKVSISDKF